MIKYYTNKDEIEEPAKLQLDLLLNDINISDIVVFPDVHYASNKSIPVGVAFKSDKIYPLVSGKDTGCGVAFMIIPKNNVIKRFDKKKYYNAFYNAHLNMSDEGLGGGNHFLSLEEDDNNLYIIVHTGTRNLGIHWYQKNLALLSEFGNDSYFTNDFLNEKYSNWFNDYNNLLEYSKQRRKEYLNGTLAFLVKNKNVINGNYKINDSIHNFIEKVDEYFIHRKGATKIFDSSVAIPLSMTRGCLIVKLKDAFPTDSLGSCAHGAGRKLSRTNSVKHWKSMKKKERKKYENDFFELLKNGKFNTNQIQELDFVYKDSDDILKLQPFLFKITETSPICTVKFSEIR